MGPPTAGLEPTTIRDPLIGTRVLGYEIVRTLGVGGMGKVYEALERNIGRRAAVKVLLPEAAERPDFVQRLQAEARAANAVRHRGIIDIFGFTQLPDGRQAIVMEFLEGTPLEEELHRLTTSGRRLPVLDAIRILDEVASVLSAAHGAGVVHRDLKPSNIFLARSGDGSTSVKVLDFGIAKFEVASVKTATNTVLGTPHYIAPEQAAGEQAAPSMDLYALGVISFELFTGRLPFIHDNVMALLLAHQQQPPPRPSSVNPSLPAVVDEFVLTLLAKHPDDRFTSASEVRDRLALLRKTLGDGTAMPTDPALTTSPMAQVAVPTRIIDGTGTLQRKAVRRSPWPWVGAACVLGALVVSGWLATRQPVALPNTPAPELPPPPAPLPRQPVIAEPSPTPPADSPPDAPVSSPPPVAPAPAKTGPSRAVLLAGRLKRLEQRLVKAEAAGASVSLERQQLQALRLALKGSPDAKRLDEIEVALGRLEEDAQ